MTEHPLQPTSRERFLQNATRELDKFEKHEREFRRKAKEDKAERLKALLEHAQTKKH